MQRGNFFTHLPDACSEEVIEVVSRMSGRDIRIERIVTEGQTTPEGEWYDQGWEEWVLILRGGAELEFEDSAGVERLGEGDWLLIPSHRRHRVRFAEAGTLWLAIHSDTPQTK